ncbi:MAG: nitroreductase family protein [Oscillospiraceae bacterium]|nr:nitroreductase family protein [Oscillospiraceae bacterium]
MEFSTLITERHAVRSYQSKKVEPEKRDAILEAGRMAPTAANLQPVQVLVIEEPSSLEKLGKAANLYGAPLSLIVCTDRNTVWKRPFDGKQTTDIDASIATDHMMLQATALGLGSVWICYFQPDVLRKEFAIPDNLEIVNILAIGYSNETNAPMKERKSMDNFSFFETT